MRQQREEPGGEKMVKLAGALMVITCTGLLGMLKARDYALRPRELRELQSALQMLETEIIYGATPLPEAMEYVAERCGKSVTSLFSRAARELANSGGCTVKEAWDEALKIFSRDSVLRENELLILHQLGNCLGMSDIEDQKKHLRLAMEQLKLEIDNARESAKTQVKMWNYMGFLAGLLLVIILY